MDSVQRIRRITAQNFIYCLRLEYVNEIEDKDGFNFVNSDAIYWGMTSNLEQRMKQHLEGEVLSTCQELTLGGWRSHINILYTVAFNSKRDAELAEKQAWEKSGYGQGTKYSCAGTVAEMNLAYRHLLDLGWDGQQFGLKYFIKLTPRYLSLWDETDPYLKLESEVNRKPTRTEKFRERRRQKIQELRAQKKVSQDFSGNEDIPG